MSRLGLTMLLFYCCLDDSASDARQPFRLPDRSALGIEPLEARVPFRTGHRCNGVSECFAESLLRDLGHLIVRAGRTRRDHVHQLRLETLDMMESDEVIEHPQCE